MKKSFIAVIAVAALSFVLALTMGIYLLVNSAGKSEKYVLYVGVDALNTTNRNQLNEICQEHVEGYTLTTGSGGYTQDGKFVNESTYILSFCFTNEKTVKEIAKEILATVDGSTVLMETVEVEAVHSNSGAFGSLQEIQESDEHAGHNHG